MNLLSALLESPTRFAGFGKNHEGETFQGVLTVQRLVGDRALMLHYTAMVDGRGEVHTESTLLASAAPGKLGLWPVMSELPFVLPHLESSTTSDGSYRLRTVFASGPRNDRTQFREEISVALHHDGRLTYAHAWGMPGGSFDDRSLCEMSGCAT